MSNQSSASNTANTTVNWQTLHALLLEEKSISENLLTALNLERTLLTERNYEALSSALTDKSLLLSQLEKRNETRQLIIKNAGFTSEKMLLSAAEKDAPNVANEWHTLATLWEQCQHENQVNNQIVRRTRIVIQRVLDILHGQPDLGKTYNPRGESNNGYSSKAITSV